MDNERDSIRITTMTVQDLIEALQEFDANDRVVMGYPYGDYARTQALLGCNSVAIRPITESGYSASGYSIAYNEEDVEGEDDFTDFPDLQPPEETQEPRFVVLSADFL